jgi:hypothetical protein
MGFPLSRQSKHRSQIELQAAQLGSAGTMPDITGPPRDAM